MPTNPRPDDPAEGSRETIDRQLKRVEGKESAEREENSKDDQHEQGTEGGVGSEEAGRD